MTVASISQCLQGHHSGTTGKSCATLSSPAISYHLCQFFTAQNYCHKPEQCKYAPASQRHCKDWHHQLVQRQANYGSQTACRLQTLLRSSIQFLLSQALSNKGYLLTNIYITYLTGLESNFMNLWPLCYILCVPNNTVIQ